MTIYGAVRARTYGCRRSLTRARARAQKGVVQHTDTLGPTRRRTHQIFRVHRGSPHLSYQPDTALPQNLRSFVQNFGGSSIPRESRPDRPQKRLTPRVYGHAPDARMPARDQGNQTEPHSHSVSETRLTSKRKRCALCNQEGKTPRARVTGVAFPEPLSRLHRGRTRRWRGSQ